MSPARVAVSRITGRPYDPDRFFVDNSLPVILHQMVLNRRLFIAVRLPDRWRHHAATGSCLTVDVPWKMSVQWRQAIVAMVTITTRWSITSKFRCLMMLMDATDIAWLHSNRLHTSRYTIANIHILPQRGRARSVHDHFGTSGVPLRYIGTNYLYMSMTTSVHRVHLILTSIGPAQLIIVR